MIGRKKETTFLLNLLKSKKSELLVITGRRRVGKTFLIKHVYKKHSLLEFTGTQNASLENQLQKFYDKIKTDYKSKRKIKTPTKWYDAFNLLKKYIKRKQTKNKKVLFFDEFPWIASHKSGFMEEFGYWWNDWAAEQNIVVVICGSATTWMIENVINHKGGLHNRVTQRINLEPFTLAETKSFLDNKNIHLDHYQILQLYMSLGGIPHYLENIEKGESAAQAINRICFDKDGLLRNEFNNLYAALFNAHDNHVSIIKALASKWKGLTRQEIIKYSKLSDGGGLTKALDELESSSFIIAIYPFAKIKKDIIYRLADEYSLFYLSFIQGQRSGKRNIWHTQSTQQKYKIWRGYAFENICIKHEDAIKNALGISGIHTNSASYLYQGNKQSEGLQIDMMIDRNDQCINLCEMKFYADDFTITKEIADKLRKRREAFRRLSKTKKTLFNTIVTTYGVKDNAYKLSQVDNIITMDKLFELDHF